LLFVKKLCSLVGNYKYFVAIYCLIFWSGTLKTDAAYSTTVLTICATNHEHQNMNTNFAVRSKVLRAAAMNNKALFGWTEICRRFGVANAPVFII